MNGKMEALGLDAECLVIHFNLKRKQKRQSSRGGHINLKGGTTAGSKGVKIDFFL